MIKQRHLHDPLPRELIVIDFLKTIKIAAKTIYLIFCIMGINPRRVMPISLSYAVTYFLTLYISGHAADNVYINFNEFNESSANLLDFLHDAVVSGNEIALTNRSKTNSNNVRSSLGRVVYKQTIPLLNSNFTTHFRFLMRYDDLQYGEGLAFFFASPERGEYIPYDSGGGGLGLFNHNQSDGREGTSSAQVVAVEFDTYKNYWDTIGDTHVGIDLNSIVSVESVAVKPAMNDGQIWDAWIDYDGEHKKLLVFLSNTSNGLKPDQGKDPLLSYDIDLRAFLPPDVMIGFSAVSHKSTETHQLISWSFTSLYFSGNKRNRSTPWVIVIVSVSFIAAVVLYALFYWVYKIRRKRGTNQMDEQISRHCDDVQGHRRFTYRQLREATMKFSEKRKLGHGGFGDVYKGVLSKTNEIVAVKRMSEGSNQGKKEYISEINTITRLRHKNLVQLLGWCHEKGELLLVYEYMPNGSLDNFLFGKRRGELGWARRHKIACDIASALFYLHELWDQCVVHRDVKCSNVMLDSHFNAKLGDFGLARLMKDDRLSQTTTLAGTLGYIAPECAVTGRASAESDVYSFGAIALEIACGKKVIHFIWGDCNLRLVEWVWDLYGKGRLMDAADGGLNGEFNREEMEQLLLIGLWCSHPDPGTRPKMRQVLQILNFEVPLPHLPPTMPVPVYSPLQQGVFSEMMVSSSDCPPPLTSNSQEMVVFSCSTSADHKPTSSTHRLGFH